VVAVVMSVGTTVGTTVVTTVVTGMTVLSLYPLLKGLVLVGRGGMIM
jgi:hypothetical protein